MSMDIEQCERCLCVLHAYSGEHLCKTCAQLTERSTYDPWWGNHKSHPDAELERRVREINERDLKFTIEQQNGRKAA
jgi:hypothetical protein